MRPRYLHLCLAGVIILAFVSSAFAQPTLGYLKVDRGFGCADLLGVAVDQRGQPYAAGRTLGCDNFALYVHAPNYVYMSDFGAGGW
jgi:hypothetical protein